MNIVAEHISKRFQYQWILNKANFQVNSGEIIGIKGHNGSGKSTFLKMIAQMLPVTEGVITYSMNGKPIPSTECYRFLSFSAPYVELIEDFSLKELLSFHIQLMTPLYGFSLNDILGILELDEHQNKQLKYFSSGMKQRVNVGLALLFQSSLVILDEPTSNFDSDAVEWYRNLLNTYIGERTAIIASNEERDFYLCDRIIEISRGIFCSISE